MKLALIGIGQAGGKIVDQFLARDRASDLSRIVTHAVAINTAETDLGGLSHIPADDRILIGRTEVGGHGVGGDNELAAEIAERELEEIHAAISDVPLHEIDAFLVVLALGGGTGSGAGPVVAAHVQEMYEAPVYGLGILPDSDEGGIYMLNAARSLQTMVDRVDNLILFDNDAWRNAGETVDASYESMNRELLGQLELPFRAGEVAEGEQVAESVVDASEIINTLGCGGITAIGYAEDTTVESAASGSKGLLSRFTSSSGPDEDTTATVNRITSLVRRATLGRLTVDAAVGSTQRGLVVVGGPPAYLSRKGIERGRAWLEEETGSMEIRGGDYPLREDRVAVSVLLAGVSDLPRIDALKEDAVAARRNIDDLRSSHSEAIDALQNEEIDSLF